MPRPIIAWLGLLALTGCSEGDCEDAACFDAVEISISESIALGAGYELQVEYEGASTRCTAEQRDEAIVWNCDAEDIGGTGPRYIILHATPASMIVTLYDAAGAVVATEEGDLEYTRGEECWNDYCEHAQVQL